MNDEVCYSVPLTLINKTVVRLHFTLSKAKNSSDLCGYVSWRVSAAEETVKKLRHVLEQTAD